MQPSPTGRIALAGSGNTAVGRAAYPRIHLQDGLYLNNMVRMWPKYLFKARVDVAQ